MRHIKSGTFIAALLLTTVIAVSSVAGRESKGRGADPLKRINHIVVIYEENHSFDNLYGRWEGVRGLDAATASNTKQVRQDGTQYACLMQNDVNLASPPLPADCTDTSFSSHFTNNPFTIDDFIPADAKTCPAPGVFAAHGVLAPNGLPGGCT